MKSIKFLLIAIVSIGLHTACDKDDDNQAKIDEEIIKTYLEEHNINAKRHSSGLYFKIIESGSGNYPTKYSTVDAYYKGYLTNGHIFDETSGESLQFSLMQVIKGWQIGIPFIKEGGKIQLFIPSELGYGANAIGSIPANSVLIFDVELETVY